jgi:hypothetical protein
LLAGSNVREFLLVIDTVAWVRAVS